jgi:hypothetical protein
VATPHYQCSSDRRARIRGRDQQVFVLRLVPLPGTDPIKALRAVLKVLLRRFGLRALSVRQDEGAE